MSLAGMGSHEEHVCGRCSWRRVFWTCVEFECSASTSGGDVLQALNSNKERELVFIRNNKTSVKILLAEFPSQATQERPTMLTNRKPRLLLKVWPEC